MKNKITDGNRKFLNDLVARLALRDFWQVNKNAKIDRKTGLRTFGPYSLSGDTLDARRVYLLSIKSNPTDEEIEEVKAYILKAKLSKDDPDFDPYIKYKLIKQEAMEYLILLGIQGLKRVLENQSFTKSIKVEKSIEEYEEANNPIQIFFKEIEPSEIENEVTSDIYRRYSEFCLANSFNPMSNIEFSKQVKKRFGFEIANKTIKGKKYRIFVKG